MQTRARDMEIFVAAGGLNHPSASLFRQNSASIARETALLIAYGCPVTRAKMTKKQGLSAKRPF
jgi:hypothetical protein